MHPILGKKILVVTAHPDDESYIAAGTIYKNQVKEGETVLVCATRGEKGTSHLKKPLSAAGVKRLRERELRRVCRALRIRKLHLFDFPDGSLSLVHHEKSYFLKVRAIARKIKPGAIVSFGPDGISGHRDHIAAGKVARRVARMLGIPFFASTLPPRLRRMSIGWIVSRRRAPHYRKGALKHQAHSLRIPIDPKVKLRAVSCHKSQMKGPKAFGGFPAYVAREFLRAEYFTDSC